MLLFVYSERTYVVYGNIMYDRRVIRGNTYAQTVIPSVRIRLGLLIYHISYLLFSYCTNRLHVITCIGWQLRLCGPIWQVTLSVYTQQHEGGKVPSLIAAP